MTPLDEPERIEIPQDAAGSQLSPPESPYRTIWDSHGKEVSYLPNDLFGPDLSRRSPTLVTDQRRVFLVR